VSDVRSPSWQEFLAAIGTVEEWLLAKIAEIRVKFPGHEDILAQLEEALRAKARTIEVLMAIGVELQALSGGKGPVVHDPVDWAMGPGDLPDDPPGA
jgi:hypothetical protein